MVFWIKQQDGGDDDYQPFHIRNISGGGILCETNSEFRVGEIVALSFELPQHTDLIEATAEVRHVDTGDEDFKYHIGLEFKEVSGVPISLLIDFLEEIFK